MVFQPHSYRVKCHTFIRVYYQDNRPFTTETTTLSDSSGNRLISTVKYKSLEAGIKSVVAISETTGKLICAYQKGQRIA